MIMRRTLFALLAMFVLSTPLAASTLADYKFDTPQQSQDFRHLIEKMRCLVCQNETIAGSNAELAVDLRNEIYEMMQAGKSKDEIVDFMVARYGDFVLYDPPVKPSTYPIWFGPLILFIIGAVLLVRTLSRKRRSQETTLTDNEQQRLNALLNAPTPAPDEKK